MKIIVIPENQNIRIDKFLSKEFFWFSRGEIVKFIKEGKVLINGVLIKPSYKLQNEDKIEILFETEQKANELEPNSEIKLDVIFEDENILAINKPAGIQIHPSYNEKYNTIVNSLIAYLPQLIDVHDQGEDSFMRPGIVHRLDKETSGILIVAKNLDSFKKLKQLFKDRKVEKVYDALVAGQIDEKEGVIEKPIARSTSYQKQVIARSNTKTKIRPAVTEYKVLEQHKSGALVEVKPKTGRMHQIRVHFESIGHPIIGDKVYGISQNNICEAQRQMLHAKSLNFELGGSNYALVAPIPEDFKKCLANID